MVYFLVSLNLELWREYIDLRGRELPQPNDAWVRGSYTSRCASKVSGRRGIRAVAYRSVGFVFMTSLFSGFTIVMTVAEETRRG